MVASHISTEGGNTACTSHKDWFKQAQSAQKTGMLQCGEPREHGLLAERGGSSWGLDQIGLFQQIGVRKMAVSGWQKKMRLNVKEARFNGQF